MRFSIMTIGFILLGLVSHAAAEPPEALMTKEKTNEGKAQVSPDFGIAGEYGTWTVTYTVGDNGISKGGGIRVQLPDAWHAGPRNSANRLQSTDPKADQYVQAYSSRDDVQLETIVESQTDNILVKHAKLSLDGRYERYVFVVRVHVAEGDLKAGDMISLVYGDRSEGSTGYRASAVSTSALPILIALDSGGDGQFRMLEEPPQITCRPGAAVSMLLHAPSQAVTGKPVRCLVSLLDKEHNPVEHSARIAPSIKIGEAELPEEVVIQPGKGYAEFEITPQQSGILQLKARTRRYELQAVSNPVRVSTKPPKLNIYWGDLHSHTHFSWDGVGDDQFNYARYTTGLDFYAMTDHAIHPTEEGYTRGLHKFCWEEYTALNDKYNDPGHFVALQAYECSFGKPYGHHNVYFRGRPGALLSPQEVSLPKLWAALNEKQALTIPHHTGKFPSGVDFSVDNPEFRRNFEIYSAHGLSEAYNPDHPLAFERSLFTSDARSLKTPTYAQDVWEQGLQLSTVASSDEHRAHPGLPHYGITAILAERLTREDLFHGLYNRRTYGTTGAKIVLDFSLHEVPMGSVVWTDEDPVFEIEAIGTDIIERVELLRHHESNPGFKVIQTWEPDSLQFREVFIDKDYEPGAIYYARVRQKYEIFGRIPMAWSSPIWTRASDS